MNPASTTAAATTDAFAPAMEKATEMTRYLESRSALAATHGELELFVEEEGRELLRRMLQGHHVLRAIAERPVRVEGADVRHYLAYDDALAVGLPIATGVIEGACRYLVKDRMEKTGARWSLAGAEAVLRLRALRASGDFNSYWALHIDREHARQHRERYADGVPPSPIPTLKPRLRRVK